MGVKGLGPCGKGQGGGREGAMEGKGKGGKGEGLRGRM